LRETLKNVGFDVGGGIGKEKCGEDYDRKKLEKEY
jgi:hypothetical protein